MAEWVKWRAAEAAQGTLDTCSSAIECAKTYAQIKSSTHTEKPELGCEPVVGLCEPLDGGRDVSEDEEVLRGESLRYAF